jgi:hypothetical protein
MSTFEVRGGDRLFGTPIEGLAGALAPQRHIQ